MEKFALESYRTPEQKDVMEDWLASLSDRRTRAIIATRLSRLVSGNFGDSRSLRDGVHELRIDYGPGFRVYYAKVGKKIVLLLGGGSKRGQNADIERACQYLKEFKNRK